MPTLYQSANVIKVKDLDLTNVQMQELAMGKALEVNISLVDKRFISDNQRRLIFALCSDIENYSGHDKELIRASAMQAENVTSLKKASVTDANKVIDQLIDFCLINQIPISLKTRNDELFSFNEKQMYMLTLSRICCITGKHADIHHVIKVGIGRNRNEISHIGMLVLPLSREMHIEIHQIGDKAFMEKYHVEPIVVDERIEYFIKKGKIKVFTEDIKEMEQDNERDDL